MAQILSVGRKLGVNGIAHLHKVLLSNDKRLKNSYGIGKEEIIIIGFCYSISVIYSKKKKKKRNVIFCSLALERILVF